MPVLADRTVFVAYELFMASGSVLSHSVKL